MKDNEKKREFIKARAEGKSYNTITKELGISKTTCSKWASYLKEDIEKLQREQMEELYTEYGMKREARIKELGKILQKIDNALEEKDFKDLQIDKLLDLKLKYSQELRKEYIEPIEEISDLTLDGLLEQYSQLYKESKAGRYTPAETKAQLAILDAKRATLIQAEEEHQKENSEDVKSLFFKSGLLRQEE